MSQHPGGGGQSPPDDRQYELQSRSLCPGLVVGARLNIEYNNTLKTLTQEWTINLGIKLGDDRNLKYKLKLMMSCYKDFLI